MSDLKPIGTPVEICGQEYNFLFTIGIIETLQESCNMPLVDIVSGVARVASYGTQIDDLRCLNTVVAAFVSADTGKKVQPEALDGAIRPKEMQKVATKILEAYGFAMPEPDDEDDDDDDKDGGEDPNQNTGQ